jgi:hypothetical protein
MMEGLIVGTIVYFAFVTLNFILLLREKRMVWPYGNLEARPQFAATGFSEKRINEAIACRFRFIGWAPHSKGGKYQVSYGFIISPNEDCLGVISAGAMYGIEVRGTTLITLTDGKKRGYATSDNQSAVDVDLTRTWKSQLAPRGKFSDLWDRHQRWLAEEKAAPDILTAGRELEDYYAARQYLFEVSASRGILRYVDESKTSARFSLIGAIRALINNNAVALARTVTFGRFPRTA